jgi:hypothetical protein
VVVLAGRCSVWKSWRISDGSGFFWSRGGRWWWVLVTVGDWFVGHRGEVVASEMDVSVVRTRSGRVVVDVGEFARLGVLMVVTLGERAASINPFQVCWANG